MRARVVICALLALVLAGCAQSSTSTADFEGEDKAVADKVADLADHGQRNRAKAICDDILADDLVAQVAAAGSSCATEMEKAIKDADGFDLEVTDVTVTGNTATATVRSTDRGENVDRDFEFVKEGGNWRITGFG
jgi:hypothetical protein